MKLGELDPDKKLIVRIVVNIIMTNMAPGSSSASLHHSIANLFSCGGAIKKLAIDPGVRNYGISCLDARTHASIDFGSFAYLEKQLVVFLRHLLALLDASTCVVFIENQRGSCQNQRVEWLTRGILSALGAKSVVGVQPYAKNKWCRERLGWTYVKCNSRKAFKNAYNTNSAFRQFVSGWTRYRINMPAGEIIAAKSVFEFLKSDEFIDTSILLAIGDENKKAPTSSEPSVGESGASCTLRRKRRVAAAGRRERRERPESGTKKRAAGVRKW